MMKKYCMSELLARNKSVLCCNHRSGIIFKIVSSTFVPDEDSLVYIASDHMQFYMAHTHLRGIQASNFPEVSFHTKIVTKTHEVLCLINCLTLHYGFGSCKTHSNAPPHAPSFGTITIKTQALWYFATVLKNYVLSIPSNDCQLEHLP